MSTWAVEARPRRFGEVAGQSHIAPVLRAMIRTQKAGGNFPPALVLFGPRGTGKTTVGRIIAKALNCPNATDGEPCDDCPSCSAITSGRSAGVDEIDMASHGSVDDIRALRDSAAYSLSEAWRVYLMDEVHSASSQAFNALLKLLEEPPPATLFLLVTTEPDRIPATIRSRAMDFEFRRIPATVITTRLRELAEVHDVTDRVDDDVFLMLASRARGGMRDAVMSLEQLCYREGQVTAETVKETFGFTDVAERLLDAALKGDLSAGLARLSEALDGAVAPSFLVDSMLEGLTALLSVSCGVRPDVGAPVSPTWLEAQAGTPPGLTLDGMKVLWDLRAKISPGSVSAPASLAVAYALLVRVLAPSRFAAPLVMPGGAQAQGPSPQAQTPHNGRRSLPADALKAILASSGPITLDQARKLADSS